MAVTADDAASDDSTADDADPFRRRLLDGLAGSIAERGYRASTVADIVRHARTSKRTFYDRFADKDECFIELVHVHNEQLAAGLAAAVDPDADWRQQIHQAIAAYIAHMQERSAIMLSWIRESSALGRSARPVQRREFELLINLLVELTGSPGFRRAGIAPLSPALAVILVGGLQELTAHVVEDGRDMRDIAEPATRAAIALLVNGTNVDR